MTQALISPYKVTAVLFVAIVVSVLLAIFLWFWVNVEPVRNPYLAIEDLPSTQMRTAVDSSEVLARPLFWLEREPLSQPEESVTEVEHLTAAPLMSTRLVGIIFSGDVRTALLEVEGKMTSVQVGQSIQGWTVETITAKEVGFVTGSEQTSLTLVRERPSSIELEKTH